MLFFLAASAGVRAGAGDSFLAARDAWAKGDMKRFEQLASKIPSDYVLRPYLEYWKVARQLTDDGKVADFLVAYPDTWLAERLRSEWLKDLGRKQRFCFYLTIPG